MDTKSSESFRGYTEQAMKVVRMRECRGRTMRMVRNLSALSFFGLMALGNPLSSVAGGVLITSSGIDMVNAERNIVKSESIKRRLKKVARKVSKECHINIQLKCNYTTRQAGYVLYDANGVVPITPFLTTETMKDYLTPDQCATLISTFENEFARMNSRRGLGEQASSSKEIELSEMPKITIDNITHAFDEVGGVLSKKELAQMTTGTRFSYIEYKKFMKEHKNEELWVFASHLSSYLNGLSDMDANAKAQILMEFVERFKRYGEEGRRELERLQEQLQQESKMEKTL